MERAIFYGRQIKNLSNIYFTFLRYVKYILRYVTITIKTAILFTSTVDRQVFFGLACFLSLVDSKRG